MLARSTAGPERACAPPGAPALLAAALSAAVLLTPLSGARPALAAGADVAAQAIQEYTQLEEKGKLKDLKSLETFRNSYGFKRNINGRVSVKGSSGQWYEVRLDMEVPGALILQVGGGGPAGGGLTWTRPPRLMAGWYLQAGCCAAGRRAAPQAAQRAADHFSRQGGQQACCARVPRAQRPANRCCCKLLRSRGGLASGTLLRPLRGRPSTRLCLCYIPPPAPTHPPTTPTPTICTPAPWAPPPPGQANPPSAAPPRPATAGRQRICVRPGDGWPAAGGPV